MRIVNKIIIENDRQKIMKIMNKIVNFAVYNACVGEGVEAGEIPKKTGKIMNE